MNKYQIIYADPPWKYHDGGLNRGGALRHYSTMKTEELANLPIEELADSNCFLFMWATMPRLPDAFVLMDAWGFKYKTVAFTWVKLNKNTPTPFWGMGNWTRSNAELCLLAVKGKPKRVSMAVHSLIQSRIQEHSRKPQDARDRIIKLCGDISRIELFARSKTEGWDTWGNEVANDIDLLKKAPTHSIDVNGHCNLGCC